MEISELQKEVVNFALNSLYHNKQVYLALEVGLGKTFVSLYIFNEMLKNKKDNKSIKALYICPKSLISQVKEEQNKLFPNLDITYRAYTFFSDLLLVKNIQNTYRDYKLVIIDEAHFIKTYSNSLFLQEEKTLDEFINIYKKHKKFNYVLRTVGVLHYIKDIPYKIFMSATPMPTGAIDIFNFLWLGKHKLITNKHSRQESFLNFARMFCKKKTTPYGDTYIGFNKENKKLLLDSISDCFIERNHKDETSKHLMIPEPIDKSIHIQIENKDLIKEEITLLNTLRKTYNVSLDNLYKLLKSKPQFKDLMLFRKSVGFAKTLIALNYIDTFGDKVIYFFNFKENSKTFYDKIKKLKHYCDCYHLTGNVSIDKTSEVIKEANKKDKAIIVATIGKASTGFNCNKFSTIVFVELDFNFASMVQARGRIIRKGIKETPHIYYLIAEGVDELIYKNLKSKNFKPFNKNKEHI